MNIERIDEEQFFDGLNARIAELAEDIKDTAGKITDNPNSSTYHIENFFHPLRVMRKLQQIRDKARAFKENEDEDIVYVKVGNGDGPRYYYFPESQYERTKLPKLIQKLERQQPDTDLGYIS